MLRQRSSFQTGFFSSQILRQSPAPAGNNGLPFSIKGDGLPSIHIDHGRLRMNMAEGQQGLGLGLYITSEIARAHDGRIEVYSTDVETSLTLKIPSVSKQIILQPVNS